MDSSHHLKIILFLISNLLPYLERFDDISFLSG